MTTLQKPARKAKTTKSIVRTLRIIQRPTTVESGIVRLTIDGKRTDYHFDVLHVDPEMGACAVEWGKGPNDQPYHVLVARDGSTSCDCKGGSYRGKCKHAAATPILLKCL